MPDQSGGWLSAALKRRPVLGLIAILILLVIAYVVTANKDTGTGTPESPSVSNAAIAGSSTAPGTTAAKPATDPTSGLPFIEESSLPKQAVTTLALIRAGGPFPYSQDGVTFQNRERVLPKQPPGYYAEYTVKTSGEADRGPRRIVVGDGGRG